MQSFNGGTGSATFRKRCVLKRCWILHCESALISYYICWALIGGFFEFFFNAMTSVKTLDYHNLIHPQLIYTLWTSCAPKLWLKTKLQAALKLPWATRGDLDDWITLNYPKPLCRCESRCAKTNDYYFQLIHMTDSSWSANLRPAGSTCTEHSGHFIWWRGHTFPTCMLQPPVSGLLRVMRRKPPDTERTLDVYVSERKRMTESTGQAEARGRG